MPIINPFRNKETGAETTFVSASSLLPNQQPQCPWEHVSIDHLVIPGYDNPELISNVHVFALKVDEMPTISAWRKNGTWHERTFVQGDIGIHPAGHIDCMRSQDTRISIVCCIEPAAMLQACAGFEAPDDFEFTTVMPANDELIAACLQSLLQEVQSGYVSGELYGETIAATLSAHYLLRYGTRKLKAVELRGGLPKLALAAVIEYMETNVHQRIRLSELASIAHISPYHFSRLFKQSTGFSPYQYLMRLRVKQARRMMNKGELTLKEISRRVGFYDASHFSRVFKRMTGVNAVEVARFVEE